MPDQLPVLNAVADLLRTTVRKPVGVVEIPPFEADEPYAIVYPYGAGFSGPPLAAPEADGAFGVQVSSVGLRCDQATWLSDRVRFELMARENSAFVNALPLVPGMREMGRAIDSGPILMEGGSVDTVVQRFIIYMTPA